MRYHVAGDASDRMLLDMTGAPEDEAFDGMKVNQRGTPCMAGPGGLRVRS